MALPHTSRNTVAPGGTADQIARIALAKLGWIEGRNLQIDLRFDEGDTNRMRLLAAEQVKLGPEVIVVNNTPATRAFQQQTKTIPIVFAVVADPISTGLVTSVANPTGNATGFPNFEPTLGGKWLELLKEAEPRIARVAVIYSEEFNPQSQGTGWPAG
jgi:putative ABC transport system substrate-binding protein